MKKELPNFREKITDNGLYKVVSLIVAVVIWVTTVTARKDVILIRSMALDYRTAQNMVIEGERPQAVRIKVAGPRAALKKFSQMSSRIVLNLRDADAGPHLLTIESSALDLPLGVKLISAEPNRIRVQLERQGTQQ